MVEEIKVYDSVTENTDNPPDNNQQKTVDRDTEKRSREIVVLTLPIKWFDLILSGIKKEVYLDIKPYWTKQLEEVFDFAPWDGYPTNVDIHEVMFRNRYGKSITAMCALDVSTGKEEWGAEPGKLYFVLKILEIKEVSL